MQHVRSVDGTRLAVDRTGAGPPLVIVVGAFCDRMTSKGLAARLAPGYTVYEYDRRGRGESGDSAAPETAREIEDLQAVLGAIGDPCFVYGHSSGGALALEVAATGTPMRKLAVYEPPYTGDRHPGREFGELLDELASTGRRGEAAERWLAVTGAPPEVIESIKQGPGWPHMEGLAHTLSRDLRLANDGRVPADRLRRITVPVLAMAGGSGAPWARAVAAAVAQAVPDGEERILDGQHHVPADDVLVAELVAFL